jgi:RNA polymerase sigma factor (sigma-70 family)
MDIEDRELWDIARSSDADAARRAFGCLSNRYFELLVQFAGKLCRRQDAPDVVSDVFASIWVRRATIRVNDTVRGYLYGAVRWRACKVWRAGRHSTSLSSLGNGSVDIERAADHDETPSNDLISAVLSEVDILPLRQRSALLLQVHGLTYAQIGSVLDISPNTVDTLLGRARKRLRQRCALFTELW